MIQSMARDMLGCESQGRIAFDSSDPALLEAGVRVRLVFEIALLKSCSRTYAEPVIVLASRERLSGNGWRGAGLWMKYLVGNIQKFEVADNHMQVLDPSNALFAEQLRRAVHVATTSFQA